MIDHLHRLKEGFTWFVLHLFLYTLAATFVPIYLKSQGVSLSTIIFLFAMSAFWAMTLSLFVYRFKVNLFLSLGYVTYSLMFLSLIIFPSEIVLFVYPFLSGLTMAIFWVPLNTIFYRLSAKSTNGMDSAIYYLVSGLIGVILPPIGGYLIILTNYKYLFASVAVLYLFLAVAALKRAPVEEFRVPLRQCITEYKRLKTISAIEGAFHYLQGSFIPVYTILFISETKNYGWFMSYLGLIGLIIAIILSYYSDRLQKRLAYTLPLFLIIGVSTLSLILAKTVPLWIIGIGVFNVFYNVSSPFRLAITLDVKKVDISFWKAREIFINLGRVLSLLVVFIFFRIERYEIIFIFYTLLFFISPLFIKHKLKELS